MQFFQAVQDTVFSVIAPLQSPEAQLALAVGNGAMAEVERVCAENPGLDPSTAQTAEGLNMLAVAARAGKIDMFTRLRDTYHFDIHAADAKGETMLHHAARGDNLDLVKLLVSEGLLASHKNHQGRTPYDVATQGVGHIRQFLLPHVFAGEQKDGSAPKLPHWLEETKSRGAPGAQPVYSGPPPPMSAPRVKTQPVYSGPGGNNRAQQPYQLPNMYDGFGTSEVRQLGRGGGPHMPTGPPPPNYTGGPSVGVGGAGLGQQQEGLGAGEIARTPAFGNQVGAGPSPHMRRAYVPYNSNTGVGQAYTAGRPTMGQPSVAGSAHGGGTAPGYHNSGPGGFGNVPPQLGGTGGVAPKLFMPTPAAPSPQQQQQQQQQQHSQQNMMQQSGGYGVSQQQPHIQQRGLQQPQQLQQQRQPYSAGPSYR